MAILTLRSVKGSPLLNTELDGNFSSLDQNKVQLGGDLGGTTSSPVVVSLQGYPVSSSTPTIGYVMTWNGTTWVASVPTLSATTTVVNTVINDISHRFDNLSQVFTLRVDQNLLAGTEYTDSKDVEVVLNGYHLQPYVREYSSNYTSIVIGPFQSEYDGARTNTFRMRGNKIIFYQQPQRKTTVLIKINTLSASKQLRKYPLNPIHIAFGD